jgi:hypothetical protein
LNRELFGQLTVTKDFDRITDAGHKTSLNDEGLSDHCAILKTLQVTDADRFDLIAEHGVIETLLWKATMHRHLTTFEAWADSSTSTGKLTLVATATGFSVSGTLTATNTLAALTGSWIWG